VRAEPRHVPGPVRRDRAAERAGGGDGVAAGGPGSAYGTHPEELARSLRFKETVEPRLRSIAHAEIDTTAPFDDVVGTLLALARTADGPTLAR
jgi:hypothetical protein